MADYIDRQEAIDMLRKFAEDCKGSTEAAAAAAMAISVISRVPSPWNSTDESLPVRNGDYICCYLFPRGKDPNKRCIGSVRYHENEEDRHFDRSFGRKVTHWMEQPDAPEVKKCES